MDKLNLLLLDLDPEWSSKLQMLVQGLNRGPVKVLKQLEGAEDKLDFDPEIVIWNVQDSGGFDPEFTRRLLREFPSLDVVLCISGITEEEIVDLLGFGVTYFCDKGEGEEGVRRNLLRFLELTTRVRPGGGSIKVGCSLHNWIELSAPSSGRFVESIAKLVQLLTRNVFPQRKWRSLGYVLREIGQNAVEWGNRYDPGKSLHLSFCLLEDRLLVKFSDEGEGFKREMLPDPVSDPLENLIRRRKNGKRTGGYGLAVVRGLSDELLFNEKGNSLVMVFYLDPKNSHSPACR